MSGHRQIRGPESDKINRALVRYLEEVAAAKAEERPFRAVHEVAAELGISYRGAEQRLSRIRRGIVEVPPEEECDCDDNGPCLRHFRQLLKSESKPGSICG
jgi:hypothetical protein